MLKKGYANLWRPEKSEFLSRFFVLYDGSGASEPRLDWYYDEHKFASSPNVRKSIFLDEVALISNKPDIHDLPIGSHDGSNMLIFLKTKGSRDYLLKFSEDSDMRDWMGALKEQLKQILRNDVGGSVKNIDNSDDLMLSGDYQEFSCNIESTTSALRSIMVGPALLRTYARCLKAVSMQNTRCIVWQYKYIRRFGVSINSFTLEGGHLSGAGEGLFIFRQCSGQEIAQIIRLQTSTKQDITPNHSKPIPPPVPLSTTPDILKKLPVYEVQYANQHIYSNDETSDTGNVGKVEKTKYKMHDTGNVDKIGKTKCKNKANKKDQKIEESITGDGKLSNVLASLSNITANKSQAKSNPAKVCEYNSLDFMMKSKAAKKGQGHSAADGEHLYGMHLVKQRTEPEVSEYAEINDVMNR